MKFLCIYRRGTTELDAPPTTEDVAAMGKLFAEMAQAGVLLGGAGCLPSRFGTRVRVDGRELRVSDGPFPETEQLVSGFCLLDVRTRAEAVEWTKRFLSVVKQGESELRELRDPPRS